MNVSFAPNRAQYNRGQNFDKFNLGPGTKLNAAIAEQLKFDDAKSKQQLDLAHNFFTDNSLYVETGPPEFKVNVIDLFDGNDSSAPSFHAGFAQLRANDDIYDIDLGEPQVRPTLLRAICNAMVRLGTWLKETCQNFIADAGDFFAWRASQITAQYDANHRHPADDMQESQSQQPLTGGDRYAVI